MNKKQFEEALTKVYTPLYKYIYSILNNKHGCDDVMMITVEIALKNIKKLKEKEKFKSWIFTIGKRNAFKYIEKYRREVSIEANQPDIIDNTMDIEGVVINNETYEMVANIINELDDKYKNVIIQRYYNGHILEEIAKIYGESLNTIKTRHRRALVVIKKAIEGYREQDEEK